MQHTCTYQPNLYMICSIALRLSPHQAKLKKSASSIRPSTILLALCMQAKMSLWSRVSAHFRMDVKKKGRAHHPALRTHQKNRRAYSGEVKTHKLPASQKPMPPGIAPIPPMAGAMPGAPMAGCCCMPPMPICCIAACCCIWTCCAYGSTPACWGPCMARFNNSLRSHKPRPNAHACMVLPRATGHPGKCAHRAGLCLTDFMHLHGEVP
eukprot:1159725-Pelagomonas_calceolata.AAC.18